MWVAGTLFFEFYENVRTVRSGVERTDNIPCADRSTQVHPIRRRVNRRSHQIPADQGERSGVAEFHSCRLAEATRKPKGGRRAALAPPAVAIGVSGLALLRLLPRFRFPIPLRRTRILLVHRPCPRPHSCRRGRATRGSCERPCPLALLPSKRLPSSASSRAVSSSQRFPKHVHLGSLKSQTFGPLVFSLFACRSHS
jgi:hypothetical protein